MLALWPDRVRVGAKRRVTAPGAIADAACPLMRRQLDPDKLPLVRRMLAAQGIPAGVSGDSLLLQYSNAPWCVRHLQGGREMKSTRRNGGIFPP